MSWLQNRIGYLREQLRIVITNPDNFEVKWTLTSSRIQFYSLIFVIIAVSGFLFSFLLSGRFSTLDGEETKSIDRKKLEAQHLRIEQLKLKIEQQESYLKNVKQVISGNIPVDSFSVDVPKSQKEPVLATNIEQTENEKKLSEKLLQERKLSGKVALKRFTTPVKGKIFKSYKSKKHPFILIKIKNDPDISACLDGTVIYVDKNHSKTWTMILRHPGNYLSVYKGMKTCLKKVGEQVEAGEEVAEMDPIENNLFHFELWNEQFQLNPARYIHF